MTRTAPRDGRRAVLSVPASEPRKIAKAIALGVDEVVIDLEDAVPLDRKDTARRHVDELPGRDQGHLAVRVNAIGSPWHDEDVAACVANPVVQSIVLPKAEDPTAIRALTARLEALERQYGRPPLEIQALIESPTGVHNAVAIAQSSDRIGALIIGYADLSASMGRRLEASWQFAQDALLLAARIAGAQAIDGPLLTVADDAELAASAHASEALGFDGKWVIHPAQVATVTQAFTPTRAEADEAREIIDALDAAAAEGRGAVQWRGRMLDEALAVRARRILGRAETGLFP